jgi:carbonic anhydrase
MTDSKTKDAYVRSHIPNVLSLLAETTAVMQALNLDFSDPDDDESLEQKDKIDNLAAKSVVQMALMSAAMDQRCPPLPLEIVEMLVCGNQDCGACEPVSKMIEHARSEGRQSVEAAHLLHTLHPELRPQHQH